MKKSFIIYTFIIFIFSSFSIFAEREAKLEELKYNEETELMYVNDEKEPFTGIAKDFYEDNSLKVEYPHKNGKIEGLAKEYYPSGKLKSEENYVDGQLNGKAITYYENGNMELKAIYKDDKVDKVIDVKTGEEISDEKNKFEAYLEYSIFGVIIALYIFFIIFKFKSFPKTSNLSDEQREKILKILIQNDENKKEIFSASKFYGIGTGYSKVASLVVDSQEVYIKAKIFSFLFIPVPIVLGYLLCYDEDQILASYSKTTFKEVKKKIQETILHL